MVVVSASGRYLLATLRPPQAPARRFVVDPTEHVFAQSLTAALSASSHGWLRARGVARRLQRADLAALQEILAADAPAHENADDTALLASVELARQDREPTCIEILVDGSVALSGGTLSARPANSWRLFEWLCDHGIELPDILSCSIEAARMKGRWVRAAPTAVRNLIEERRWCRSADGIDPSLSVKVATGKLKAAELLSWHGAIDAPWRSLPACTNLSSLVLEALPLETVARSLQRPNPSTALIRGCARELGGRIRTRACAAEIARLLKPEDWRRLLAVCDEQGDTDAITRLTLSVSGGRPEPVDNARLIACANHGRFERLHADDQHIAAFDGWNLRWFGEGVPADASVPAGRLSPLAVHRRQLLFQRQRATRLNIEDRSVAEASLEQHWWRWRPGLTRLTRNWSKERARVLGKHFGASGSPARTQEENWLLAEPTSNDIDAFDAFHDLGLTPPDAFALRHLWVWRPDRSALFGLPRQRHARLWTISFREPVLALAAGRSGVHLLTAQSDTRCTWWSLDEDGKRLSRGSYDVAPSAIRAIRRLGDDLLVHAADGLGDYLLRLQGRAASPRPAP